MLSIAKVYYPLMTAPWELVIGSHLKGSIYARAAIALSVLAILIWASATAPQMLFLLTLIFLPIVRWHVPGRAIVVWFGASWMAPLTMAEIGENTSCFVDFLKPLGSACSNIRLALRCNEILLIPEYWLVWDQRIRRSEPSPVRQAR